MATGSIPGDGLNVTNQRTTTNQTPRGGGGIKLDTSHTTHTHTHTARRWRWTEVGGGWLKAVSVQVAVMRWATNEMLAVNADCLARRPQFSETARLLFFQRVNELANTLIAGANLLSGYQYALRQSRLCVRNDRHARAQVPPKRHAERPSNLFISEST